MKPTYQHGFTQRLLERGWQLIKVNDVFCKDTYEKNGHIVKFGLDEPGMPPTAEFPTMHVIQKPDGTLQNQHYIGFARICRRLLEDYSYDEIIDILEQGKSVEIKSISQQEMFELYKNKSEK